MYQIIRMTFFPLLLMLLHQHGEFRTYKLTPKQNNHVSQWCYNLLVDHGSDTVDEMEAWPVKAEVQTNRLPNLWQDLAVLAMELHVMLDKKWLVALKPFPHYETFVERQPPTFVSSITMSSFVSQTCPHYDTFLYTIRRMSKDVWRCTTTKKSQKEGNYQFA